MTSELDEAAERLEGAARMARRAGLSFRDAIVRLAIAFDEPTEPMRLERRTEPDGRSVLYVSTGLRDHSRAATVARNPRRKKK